MGVREKVKERIWTLSRQVTEAVMADEKRAAQVAKLLGRVQQGGQLLGKGKEAVLRTLSLATRTEIKELNSKLSTLQRKLRQLEEKTSKLP